jgi:YVTN family beta-propeller protein
MNEQRTSGIATVMFTDVEASTDMTTRLGDEAAAALLATHDAIVLAQVAAHGGRDVRSTGDGFLVFFDSARAAVSCALSIQRELAEREEAVRVRIGINAGEVLEGEGDRFGAAINLASRVMDRAQGGEILMTDTVHHLVGTMAGASFRDRGRVALKGFPERQRLYAIRPDAARPARPPAARRWRRAWPLVAGLVGAAAIAGAVAIVHDSESPAAVSVPPNSVAVVDPRSGSVVAAIRTDENPGPVSAGAGGLWVLNLNSATVSRIDVRTRRVIATAGLAGTPFDGGAPGGLVASRDEVWANAAGCNGSLAGKLLHLFTARAGGIDLTDADSVPVADAVPAHPYSATGPGGCGLAARGTSVWAGTNLPPGVVRVDYDRVTGRSHIVWARPLAVPNGLVVGFGSIWAIDPQHQIVRRLDADTGRTEVRLHPGANPVAIATDAQAVWVANADDNSVSRIDPRTNRVVQAIAVGKDPEAIATGDGGVWVAMSDAGSIARIDPRTNRVTATIAIGHRPQGVAVAGGLVWVTVRS